MCDFVSSFNKRSWIEQYMQIIKVYIVIWFSQFVSVMNVINFCNYLVNLLYIIHTKLQMHQFDIRSVQSELL